MKECSSWIHFRIHRTSEWLNFLIRYPYHKIFHSQKSSGDFQQWANINGAIACNCGYVCDLGTSYGLHCEGCYSRVTLHSKSKGENT